tara:strand:- start:2799 stop:3035 length:237 start_codon:yes stop_codon:yes gene_type:complete
MQFSSMVIVMYMKYKQQKGHDGTSGGSKVPTTKMLSQHGTSVPISFCCNIGKNIVQKRRRMHKRANEILVGYSMEAML